MTVVDSCGYSCNWGASADGRRALYMYQLTAVVNVSAGFSLELETQRRKFVFYFFSFFFLVFFLWNVVFKRGINWSPLLHCLLPVCDRFPCLTTKVWLRVARKLSLNLSGTSYQYVAKLRRTRKTDKLNPENAGAIHKQKVQKVTSKKKMSNEVRFEPEPARFQVQTATSWARTAMTEDCDTTTGIVN